MGERDRHAVEARLARIEGHVHAIHTMIHEGKGYPEIAHQIAAVRSALDSALGAIVEDLARDCLAASRGKGAVASAVEELREVVATSL
ncbi:MAG TPA: metal-sensitive transcriptional regulator [Thermoplasmata archaeon]|nr:metal-sensitive transcriptional regulator [Thermoplasmata archaeon]